MKALARFGEDEVPVTFGKAITECMDLQVNIFLFIDLQCKNLSLIHLFLHIQSIHKLTLTIARFSPDFPRSTVTTSQTGLCAISLIKIREKEIVRGEIS